MTTAAQRNHWTAQTGSMLLLALAVVGAVQLLAAYAFASLAIDSGSLWEYALALLFLVWSLRNFVLFIRTLIGGKSGKKRQTTKA